MRAWSCGLTSAVGTAISLAGPRECRLRERKPRSGRQRRSPEREMHLKFISLIASLIERASWMDPNLSGV